MNKIRMNKLANMELIKKEHKFILNYLIKHQYSKLEIKIILRSIIDFLNTHTAVDMMEERGK